MYVKCPICGRIMHKDWYGKWECYYCMAEEMAEKWKLIRRKEVGND